MAGSAGVAGSAGAAGSAGMVIGGAGGAAGMGGAAGSAPQMCDEAQLSCPNGTCGATRFRFESGTTEGFTVASSGSLASSGPAMATTFEGGRVLRADMRVDGNNRNLSLRKDLCGGAPTDQRGKTFSANVLLDGPGLPQTSGQHSLALHVWTTVSSFFVAEAPMPGINTWYTVRGTLDDADAAQLIGIGVYVYVNGAGASSAWPGSLYVDDVYIE